MRPALCFYLFIVLFTAPPAADDVGVPRLGVQSELQLLAYPTATATWDRSCLCDLHHSSRPRRVLHPLGKARDGTCILMDPSWVCYR